MPPPGRRFVPKLTREQARFIIWCLAYDRMQRKANGFKNHRYGLLTKLGKKFGVSRECIVQINKRRTWRSINWPKPKQLGGPPSIQAMSTETYSQRQRRKNGRK